MIIRVLQIRAGVPLAAPSEIYWATKSSETKAEEVLNRCACGCAEARLARSGAPVLCLRTP
jgi:hypothetical protein